MKIYRNGVEIFELKDYKQTGRFMEVAVIDATVKSPIPIEFKIGDYVVFDYNNLTYTLYDFPSDKKQSKSGTYAEAFIYELKFKADTEQLAICPFLDLVPEDNELHYSSLPSFSTFENVYGIAARIQANLDSMYPGKWSIKVAETTDAELSETLNEAKEYSISGESCFDGLKKIYDTWGVGYIHTYENKVNVITIGKSAGTTSKFRYGKGQGLRTIRRSAQNTEQFCTRAYVYGSTRNIPARWYNEKKYIGEAQYAPNLLIPPFKWVGGVPKGAYIDAIFGDDNRVKEYGIRVKTLMYDGSDSNKDEIFPSVEKVTAGNIRAAKEELKDTTYIPSSKYSDSERMDYVLSGTQIEDNGVLVDEGYTLYDDKINYHTNEYERELALVSRQPSEKERDEYVLLYPETVLPISEYKITKPAQYRIDAHYNIISIRKYETFSEINVVLYLIDPLGERIILNSNTFSEELFYDVHLLEKHFNAKVEGTYRIEAQVSVYNWLGHPEPEEDIEGIPDPNLKITVNNSFTIVARGKNLYEPHFNIKIKQIGFNINDTLASSGTSKTISMKSGMCSGRSFPIYKCQFIEEEDAWLLTCKRTADSSISQNFPNNIFKIAEGDQFILLNMSMPDLYVHTAMQRLYNTALADLKYLSTPQFIVEPEIDNIQMARSVQTLKEGMYMAIEDDNIPVSGEILIDSVTITNKGTELRKFDVTLRNDKIYNKFSKIASRISDLESTIEEIEKSASVSPVEGADEEENNYTLLSDQIENTRKNLQIVTETVNEIKGLWSLDKDNNAVYTPLNLIAGGTIAMGDLGSGSGDTPVASSVVIKFEGEDTTYAPINGVITLPAYPEGGGEGGIDEAELEQYLKTNQYAKKSDIPSLAGYATESWVKQQGYLTQHQDLSAYAKSADVALVYATKAALQTLQNEHNALNTKVTNLDNLLNSDVSGVINTWGEVVDFLNEYSGSEDLATILSGMNAAIGTNTINITAVSNRVQKFEDIIDIDDNGDVYIKGTRNFYTEGGTISMFGLSEGDSGDVASVSIKFEGSDDVYSAIGGIITLPAYPSGGGVADSVAWSNVTNKPTTLGGYGITDALSTSGGTIDGATTYPLIISNSTDTLVGTVFSANGANRAIILAGGDWHAAFVNPQAGYKAIGVRDDGTPFYGDSSTQNTLLHSGNYTDYALSKSGGTISNNIWAEQLTINGENTDVGIRFNYNNNLVGYLFSASNNVLRWYNGTDNTILHSGNYSSYALPLSGGTIKGSLYIGDANTLYNGASTILLRNASSTVDYGTYIINGWAGGDTRIILDSAAVWFRDSSGTNNTLIHSGNIGSYKAGDSFLLDGRDSSGYGHSLLNELVGEDMNTVRNGFRAGKVFNMSNANFDSGFRGFLEYGANGYVAQYSSDSLNNLYYRWCENGVWKAWREFAFTDSNVASATKLQTARTIWGQSFDGTGNVSGKLSNATAISFDTDCGVYQGSTFSGSMSKYDIAYYGTNHYFHNFSSGYNLIIKENGNVLIGTISDNGAKLQVNGDIDGAIFTSKTRNSPSVNTTGYFRWGVFDEGTGGFKMQFGGDDCSMQIINKAWDKALFDFSSAGNLTITGTLAFGSDIRYKDIIENTSIDIETIANAPLFNYKWSNRQDDKEYLGTTAQYWYNTEFRNAVIPTNDEKLWTMSYSEIAMGNTIVIARELLSVKREISKMEKLENRVAKLEKILVEHNINFN